MKRILCILSVSLLFWGCNKYQTTCKDAICTMEVRSFGLVLRTASGTIPPSVDYCETYLNGRLLNSDVGQVIGSVKQVNILNDSHRSQFTLNKAESIQVRVYQQGAVTKEVSFGILADCCHINRLSGPDTVIVQ